MVPNAPPLELAAVGTAPEVDGIADVIVVDASAMPSFVPNTIWVTGPGGSTFGPLALRALTGQIADPTPVVAWWTLALIAVTLLMTLLAVVGAETALRRRRSLGDVLRVGGS
jgi:hypothetical protein